MGSVLLCLSNYLSFCVCSIALLILGIIYLLKYAFIRKKYSKLIPGFKTHFIDVLGNLQMIPLRKKYPTYNITTVFMDFLQGFYYMFKNESIFIVWIGYYPFIALVSPEAVEEVLNGTKFNEKAWLYDWLNVWLGTGLLTSAGKKWKSRRKLLTPAFHFDILKDFLPIFDEKSKVLVKILEKETSKDFTNIVQPVTLCSLDIICETTLGVNINCQKEQDFPYVKAVARVSDVITNRIVDFLSWYDFIFFLTTGRGIVKDLKLLHAFTMSVIQEKRKLLSESSRKYKPKRKPLIDVLLLYQLENNELTDEDIREEVDTFTFEGHDTTSMAMSWTLYFIGLYKDVQEKVHEELDRIFGDDKERPITTENLREMKYLECVIKETLRLCPSVPVFARRTDRETKLCGYPIPKNASIVISPSEMHKNEKIYPNAEVFDPNRFTPENSANRHPFAYIPFSAGARNCIGQRFAMMEEKTVVANILRNFSIESLDQRDKVLKCLEIILRPTNGIRIKIRSR